MLHSSIIECQVDWYRNLFTTKKKKTNEPSHVYIVQLLEKLTPTQLYQLQSGDGNPIANMYQINSSAGMAVNYYKLFERTHKNVSVGFEWKDSIPLLGSSKPANIDVKYELDGIVHFVECKFLEPYESENHKNNPAYMDTRRYPFNCYKECWRELIEKENEFKYTDFAQLCRHLMAIYRYYLESNELLNKRIVLESVSWKMTKTFLNHYASMGNSTSEFENRIEIIGIEQHKCNQLFSDFLKKIHWGNCSFIAHHYNDPEMLDAIREANRFDDFKKQYFIED